MKNHYLIAGIPIAIFHRDNPFLMNNLEFYETDLVCEHTIKTLLVKAINPLQLPIQKKDTFRRFYQDSEHEYLEVYYQGSDIKYLIKRSLDFREIEISIVERFCNNVDESEYILLSMSFMDLAVHHGFLPLHASAIVIGEECVLFSAPSGVGKSTHASHYVSLFPEAIQLNDDKPLIKDNQVYGTPFSGKTSDNINRISSLKAIVFLKQGIQNIIKPLGEEERVYHLVRNTLRPSSEIGWTKVTSVMNVLVKTIPMYEATVTKDQYSAYYTYYAAFKENKMQVKPGFVIKQVGSSFIVVPIESTALQFNGMLTLNPSGKVLFEALQVPQSIESLVDLLVQQYEVDVQTAKNDAYRFLGILESHHLLK